VRLFAQIDRELKVRLPISLLFDAPTVRDLARIIRKGISPSVIVPIRPYGRSAPVFLIQSYLLYNAILELVEFDRPVYGVREMGDEPEPMKMEDRAKAFAKEIISVCPRGQLYLAGWCAAGSLTVEIARLLRETGREVGLVALFDAEFPGFSLPSNMKARVSRLAYKLVFHYQRIRRTPWREKATYFSDALVRRWDAVLELFRRAKYRGLVWLRQKFGVSLSVAALYHSGAEESAVKDIATRPYPGKLTLFRAADVPNLAESDATLGWAAVAQGGVKVSFVPGDHESMFKKPNNLRLAQILQHELQESDAAAVSA
jgi:thioesterase domain-containing protein